MKPCVLLRDTRFRLVYGETCQFEVVWADVREVVAYKEDCFCYDEICVGFRVDDSDNYFRVMESSLNYELLLKELPQKCPGVREDWFEEVAFPAFAPNWTRLWSKPN
jgi:hypothetical protein